MSTDTRADAVRGFTLIEVLVVIGIIAMLFVALLPMIGGAEEQEKVTRTTAILRSMEQAAEGYSQQRRFGDYPPDDFKDTTGKLEISRGNGTNVGIESFVFFVNRADSSDGAFPGTDNNWLGNTDGDSGKPENAKLQRTERVEILDAWGNPFAYFHKRNYTTEQSYRLGEAAGDVDEVEQPVQAWKDGARYLNLNTYQLFSAGPDRVYNTSDDIGNFQTPQDG
ncbi:MAG: type II secretion system protein [Planctomycetes bacterium]|nr:type II secretion system protein [Planctomycetota bacterium]